MVVEYQNFLLCVVFLRHQAHRTLYKTVCKDKTGRNLLGQVPVMVLALCAFLKYKHAP